MCCNVAVCCSVLHVNRATSTQQQQRKKRVNKMRGICANASSIAGITHSAYTHTHRHTPRTHARTHTALTTVDIASFALRVRVRHMRVAVASAALQLLHLTGFN